MPVSPSWRSPQGRALQRGSGRWQVASAWPGEEVTIAKNYTMTLDDDLDEKAPNQVRCESTPQAIGLFTSSYVKDAIELFTSGYVRDTTKVRRGAP